MKQLGTAIVILTAITFGWVGYIFAQEAKPKRGINTLLNEGLFETNPDLSQKTIEIESVGYYYILSKNKKLNRGVVKNIDDIDREENVFISGINNELELQPGTHTLQVILVDKEGKLHSPPMILKPITIRMKSMEMVSYKAHLQVENE